MSDNFKMMHQINLKLAKDQHANIFIVSLHAEANIIPDCVLSKE